MNIEKKKKCLNVAEEVLRAMEDKTIYERYENIKTRIMANSVISQTNKSSETSIEAANNELNSYINSVQKSKEFSHVEDYVLSELQKIQLEILPSTSSLIINNLDEQINSLLHVIETKVTGHMYMKRKITEENERLKQSIINIKNVSIADTEEGQKRRIDNDEAWRLRKERYEEMRKNAEIEILTTRKRIDRLRQENVTLETEYSGLNVQSNEYKQILQNGNIELGKLSDDIISKQDEIEHLKYELSLVSKADENLEKIQKFDIRTSGDLLLEKHKLENELEKLRARNLELSAMV